MLVYTRRGIEFAEEPALKRRVTFVSLLYAMIIAGLRFEYHRSVAFAGNFPRTLASFVLLFAPLWFFGFGVAEALARLPQLVRVVMAGALAVPYFVSVVGTASFRLPLAALTIAAPIGIASCLALPDGTTRMHWRDALALAVVIVAYFTRWFQPALAEGSPALAFFPKLFLATVVLYSYLVVRRLEGTGYCLIPTWSSALIGLREWIFYVPVAFVIGELTGFVHFHAGHIGLEQVVTAVLLTFLLIAIPEELFFRGILQNLLETRFGRTGALVIAAILFGLSHFNHGARFNWRYVLLATLAGIFYGRAWRANRQIFASLVTHTAVDVVWSFWFR